MHGLMLFLHLIGLAVWIGGMAFAHFCLRPAALELPPPQRLPLMAGALGRFFAWVIVAIVLLWVSGLSMMLAVGMAAAPVIWHLMMGIALLMTLFFIVIRAVHFPALRAAVAEQKWPAGAAALNRIRQLVAVNLALGVVTIAVATVGRMV